MVYITFTINIPQMLAYIPYMDPMGVDSVHSNAANRNKRWDFIGLYAIWRQNHMLLVVFKTVSFILSKDGGRFGSGCGSWTCRDNWKKQCHIDLPLVPVLTGNGLHYTYLFLVKGMVHSCPAWWLLETQMFCGEVAVVEILKSWNDSESQSV